MTGWTTLRTFGLAVAIGISADASAAAAGTPARVPAPAPHARAFTFRPNPFPERNNAAFVKSTKDPRFQAAVIAGDASTLQSIMVRNGAYKAIVVGVKVPGFKLSSGGTVDYMNNGNCVRWQWVHATYQGANWWYYACVALANEFTPYTLFY